jgi:hypothetical protein
MIDKESQYIRSISASLVTNFAENVFFCVMHNIYHRLYQLYKDNTLALHYFVLFVTLYQVLTVLPIFYFKE